MCHPVNRFRHYNLVANWCKQKHCSPLTCNRLPEINLEILLTNCVSSHSEIRVDTNAPTGTVVSFMPMYHIYGIAVMVICLTVGKTLVSMARFDFEQYLKLVQRYRVGDDGIYGRSSIIWFCINEAFNDTEH